eukprot:m.61502 g.61502  ORF g.61502 m.61502 type:complete len:214 (+) comp13727_c0_seq1:268-909(+)
MATSPVSKTQLPTYKILIVGQSNVGKTSIVMRYTQNKVPGNYKMTIGVDFFSKTVTLQDGKDIQLQLWDIAGQERFSAMSPIYYRNADACVIVFDLSTKKTFEEVGKWKESLANHADDYFRHQNKHFPVFLMGNKADKLPHVIKKGEIDDTVKKEGLLEYFEVSALTSNGVREAFKVIAEQISGTEGLEKARSSIHSLPPEPAESSCVLCKPS